MRWRVRVAFAVVPVGWLLMGDTQAFVIALLGACTLALILIAGSALARLETHAERVHQIVGRWR